MTKSAKDAFRTILVTGATGVVGQPLVRRLLSTEGSQVLCLVHRSPLSNERARSIPGDITQFRLGIPSPTYRDLVASVDAVVHAAATVDFNSPDDSMRATNIDGVHRILDFVAEADVPLYHVSTAYADAQENGQNHRTGVRYAKSKKQGDELVRSSGRPQAIIRPAIVIGDSLTGEVASFQAIYQAVKKLLDGHIAVVPFRPDVRLDLIPCDIVAAAIATLLERQVTEGEYWITNGADALTVHDVVKMVVQFSELIGRPVPMPQFVSGDGTTRLLDSLPASASSVQARKSAAWLSNWFGAYLLPDSCLPSSRSWLVDHGVEWLSSPTESLKASLRYWGQTNGFVDVHANGMVPVYGQ